MNMYLKKENVDYVNPNIGTIGHLLTATSPTVAIPHGMVQAVPIFTPGVVDHYLTDKIYGFAFSRISLMAASGEYDTVYDAKKYSSNYDHDFETVSPYYYAVLLEDYDIQVEYSPTAHAVYNRITFPENKNSNLIIGFGNAAVIKIIDNTSILCSSKISNVNHYYYVTFSNPFSSYKMLTQSAEGDVSTQTVGVLFTYATNKDEYIDVKIGVSYISAEQAIKNAQDEMKDWDLDAVKQKARDIWNNELNKIQVSGGSEEQKTIFYTALYRSLLRMQNITEDGKYFSGFDSSVHEAEGHDFYVNDGMWDTYRDAHPLQLIIEPKTHMDVVRSYIRMYEQCGWLPSFPFLEGSLPLMLGNHTAAFITDTYMKGLKDFNLLKAYEAMKKNALEATKLPWRSGPITELDKVFLEKGFFPALAKGQEEWVSEVHSFERRQAVSVTLEHAYDDWCIAQIAKELNLEEDYQYFMKRSYNYKNVYNEETGFMSPKTADEKWVEGFDPKLGGGQGGRDYFAECNSWIYSFSVQHDIEGLMDLMGGKKKFEERLDALFIEQYDVPKYYFLKQFPDATGLMGQYCQGNEPAFHIPYLYNHAGTPWKTQRKVREIMKLYYNDGPFGICGDEDGGAMSSWYVFSAMGFYPVCPGKPVYDIGSPIFEEVQIDLGQGKAFTIKAENASSKNKYIQSAVLNGKHYNKSWFNHADLSEGGTIVLIMGDRPNKEWGKEERRG